MFFVVKEGSSDYKKVRKRWFFKEPLTEWFFNGIPVNNFLSIFIFVYDGKCYRKHWSNLKLNIVINSQEVILIINV